MKPINITSCHSFHRVKFLPRITTTTTTSINMGPLTLCIVFFTIIAQAYSQALHDICPWETFKASCNADEVIVMETARYGRMQLGRCIEKDLGYIGCSINVIDLLDSRCSGKTQCEFQTPDRELSKLQPCLKDLTSYLEVSYHCVKGELLIQCEFFFSIIFLLKKNHFRANPGLPVATTVIII